VKHVAIVLTHVGLSSDIGIQVQYKRYNSGRVRARQRPGHGYGKRRGMRYISLLCSSLRATVQKEHEGSFGIMSSAFTGRIGRENQQVMVR
jgi:hypothetical protein